MKKRVLVAAVALATISAPAAAKPPTTFNPVVEAQNYSITLQRQAVYETPDYQARLTAASQQGTIDGLATQAADPERNFVDDLCWNHGNGCAGDIRLNDWANNHYGIVQPVLFTARNGATISGHVWATTAGAATRPGIVITDGSVQANRGSPTRPSARRCAARTSSTGTRARGSTSTSSTSTAPISGCGARDGTRPVSASVDPAHDGNALSFYYYSRLDIGLFSGGRFVCEDMRDGCPGMVSSDGYPGNYSYLAIDTSPDATR